ncbi:hypothetical protein M0R89_14580 [Halorussus limi]|uniref:DUF7124 domain-containing protein n=1 Tax=Halorussus limi TaxID=2938695 RepID=A0A8U0HSC0_9EURY|nr:hypothetical protein [Halorussus limi]UPV73759.1 hypothetical protein M0R89_14580 [Halorussus limi]
MTERIDLDDLDVGDDGEDEGPNPGDWFWREEDAPDAPEAVTDVKTDVTADSERSASATPDSPGLDDGEPIPRVPRENEARPAGIPTESGGAGAGAGTDTPAASADASASADDTDAGSAASADAPAADGRASADSGGKSEATGPHGGGADDMTLAFTYAAATRFPNFGAVAVDANQWADWVGIVGQVPAHVLNKFQRDRNVDLDFFNGSARGPAERLAAVGPTSMFYAERMVLVGVEGRDEEIAQRADWEFVPLSEAAEKAGWEVAESPTDEGATGGRDDDRTDAGPESPE